MSTSADCQCLCVCQFTTIPTYEIDLWRDSELARSAVLGFLRSINSQGGECVATDVRENETRGAGPIKRKWASTGGRRNLGYSSPSSGYAANLCILCLYFCRSRARNDARARTCMRSRIRGPPPSPRTAPPACTTGDGLHTRQCRKIPTWYLVK